MIAWLTTKMKRMWFYGIFAADNYKISYEISSEIEIETSFSFLRKVFPKFSIKEIRIVLKIFHQIAERIFALSALWLLKRIAFFIGYTKIVALCKLLGLLFSAFRVLLGLQHFFFFVFFVVGHKTQRLQLRIARGNVERKQKTKTKQIRQLVNAMNPKLGRTDCTLFGNEANHNFVLYTEL